MSEDLAFFYTKRKVAWSKDYGPHPSHAVDAYVLDWPRAFLRLRDHREVPGRLEVIDSFTRDRWHIHVSFEVMFVPDTEGG